MPPGFFGVAFDGVCCHVSKIGRMEILDFLATGVISCHVFQGTIRLSLRNCKHVLRRATSSNNATHEEVHIEQTRSPFALPYMSSFYLALGDVSCTESRHYYTQSSSANSKEI
jgi:hypothetical protein